jgi:hypothetical protein
MAATQGSPVSGWKAYRVTPQGKFEPQRLDRLLIGIWAGLFVLVGLIWWGGYHLVTWLWGLPWA